LLIGVRKREQGYERERKEGYVRKGREGMEGVVYRKTIQSFTLI
jgi:hypothetical protein